MNDCTKCYLRAFKNPYEFSTKEDLEELKVKVEEHFKIMCIRLREPKKEVAQYYCNELSSHLRELQARQSQGRNFGSAVYQRQQAAQQSGGAFGCIQGYRNPGFLNSVFGGCL